MLNDDQKAVRRAGRAPRDRASDGWA
jgi:hypothetical protein